jgi:serine/threonine protein kinase
MIHQITDDADMQLENSELERAENFFNSSGKISKEDFDIIKVIGRGGFGKVYMVKKRSNKKVFAMKVLSKD